MDATVAYQEIRFPTDLNLLSVSRENLERMIDLMYNAQRDKTKLRTYRRKARKEYLNVSKNNSPVTFSNNLKISLLTNKAQNSQFT